MLRGHIPMAGIGFVSIVGTRILLATCMHRRRDDTHPSEVFATMASIRMISRKLFLTALAVLSTSVCVCAQEAASTKSNFIVQPRLQTQAPATAEPAASEAPPAVSSVTPPAEPVIRNKVAFQPPKLQSAPDLKWFSRGELSERQQRASEASFDTAQESTDDQLVGASAPQSFQVTTAPSLAAATPTAGGPTNSTTLNFESSIPTFAVAPRSASEEDSLASKDRVKRQKLASLVSSQIIAGRTQPDPGRQAVLPVDGAPGWQSVGEQLAQHLSNCEALLKRNAFFSARSEAEAAVLHLVRLIDLSQNRYHSEPTWFTALRAMREADDFALSPRLSADDSMLSRIVASHETPVLKDAQMDNLAPMTAAQHYRLFAEQCLVEASQHHPWASDVYYGLGRTFQAQAESGDEHAVALRNQAAIFYRAAIQIAPSNALAANQLGYLMLQLDRPQDAKNALLQSINFSPSAASLQNLTEACRRLGDEATAQWAISNLANFQTAPNTGTYPAPIVEVTSQEFARMSPYGSGPAPVR